MHMVHIKSLRQTIIHNSTKHRGRSRSHATSLSGLSVSHVLVAFITLNVSFCFFHIFNLQKFCGIPYLSAATFAKIFFLPPFIAQELVNIFHEESCSQNIFRSGTSVKEEFYAEHCLSKCQFLSSILAPEIG